jgi:hypothetical protein
VTGKIKEREKKFILVAEMPFKTQITLSTNDTDTGLCVLKTLQKNSQSQILAWLCNSNHLTFWGLSFSNF